MSDYDFDPDDLASTPEKKPEKKDKKPNTEKYTDQYDDGLQTFERHDTPNAFSALIDGVKQRLDNHRLAVEKRKTEKQRKKDEAQQELQIKQERDNALREIAVSEREMQEAHDQLLANAKKTPEQIAAEEQRALEEIEAGRKRKRLEKQRKIEDKEGLRDPAAPELDGHLNMPKMKSHLHKPPNTKIYAAIVAALVLGGAWYFLKDKVDISFNTPSVPTVSAPETIPEAPVEEKSAPVADPVDPTQVANETLDPIDPPGPPLALPPLPNGEYTNVVVPKDAVFEKPGRMVEQTASAPVQKKVKQKTAEQLQEEEERRIVEEQMKKLDTWNK